MSLPAPERIVAIDWSGRVDTAGQRKHIWIADLKPDGQTLEAGRTREEVEQWLVAARAESRSMLVGLDFSFSLPAWFVREQCASPEPDIAAFWRVVEERAEEWLSGCEPPFWGRPARTRPPGHAAGEYPGLRHTELALKGQGFQPKSTFQVGGAGAVGTGSLRGMPMLARLRQAGFAIWPFDRFARHTVVEIYPRLFTGRATHTAKRTHREQVLAQEAFAWLPPSLRGTAAASEDAFDALCSAVAMRNRGASPLRRAQPATALRLLEGQIWAA